MVVVENLRAILPLVYATPSLLLSVALIVVLLLRFRTRFYMLYAFGLTVDWISSTFHYFSHRAYGAPLFYGFYATLPTTGFLPSMVVVGTRYFTYLQFEVCLALSVERLAAVLWINHAKKVNLFGYAAASCVLLLVPFVLFSPVAVAGGYLQWNPAGQDYEAFYRFRIQEAGTQCYVLGAESDNANQKVLNHVDVFLDAPLKASSRIYDRDNLITACVSAAVVGILIVLNATMCAILYRHRKAVAPAMASTSTRDVECKLCFVTCVQSLSLALFCATKLMLFAGKLSLASQMSYTLTVQTIALDLHACLSPWALLAMSKAVRSSLLDVLCGKRKTKSKPVLVHTRTATDNVRRRSSLFYNAF